MGAFSKTQHKPIITGIDIILASSIAAEWIIYHISSQPTHPPIIALWAVRAEALWRPVASTA